MATQRGHVDLDAVMAPATAATLPYGTRLSTWVGWLRHLVTRAVGHGVARQPAARRGPDGPRLREYAPAIARGQLHPHSGRRGRRVDDGEPANALLAGHQRLRTARPRELRAQGRAAAVGLLPEAPRRPEDPGGVRPPRAGP
jgi:hypothetical protein